MPRYVEGGASGGRDGSDDKSFFNKPAKGWQHSDNLLLNDGVDFNVRVIQYFFCSSVMITLF